MPFACAAGQLPCLRAGMPPRCLRPLAADGSECPTSLGIANCISTTFTTLDYCEGDGECGTSNGLNNCNPGGWDMYQIMPTLALQNPPPPPPPPPLWTFGPGTFLNTATNQCEVECTSGRRMAEESLSIEELPRTSHQAVSEFLAANPKFAARLDEELVDYMHKFGEQLFGQPALAL